MFTLRYFPIKEDLAKQTFRFLGAKVLAQSLSKAFRNKHEVPGGGM